MTNTILQVMHFQYKNIEDLRFNTVVLIEQTLFCKKKNSINSSLVEVSSTRTEEAKARMSREMDMISDFDNIDVKIGNENTNTIENELANAIEESSVFGDIESNMQPRNEFREISYKNNDNRPNEEKKLHGDLLK